MTQTTYFRIQSADRDPTDLLIPANQVSYHWNNIESAEYTRTGVSVCDSRETLAAYLAKSGIPYGDGDWVIVEVTGDLSDDEPYDAADGELLVHPDEIVSVGAMDDAFFALIDAAYDNQEG